MTCLAIGCALLFSAPSNIAVPALIFLTVALPAVLTAGVVYTRGASRAFCIGGLFPSGLALYVTGWMVCILLIQGARSLASMADWVAFYDEIAFSYRIFAAGCWVMTILLGLIVVLVRHFALKSTENVAE